MKTTRLLLTTLASAGLMCALLAAPSALADRAACEGTCAAKGGDTLQACMNQCPPPALPSKGGDGARFQSCATRCTQKYEATFKACSSRCPKDGPSGKEKAASLPDSP
ncbi:hypothetical protein [Pyxidicoccus xibeiensis]|uniref:hypothetical protein n=1 Tax=Pyxidicoccus xibeiensis TaxID=2906759 RepID=UPI0020A802CD|nr:hypothetical protein [Pyxidicoccus xibeiensis]MCP3136554.1 hypothetical protein [Pyxidicoccus xibeiensis]